MNYFEEDFKVFDVEEVEKSCSDCNNEISATKIELIHDALVVGLRNYFKKLGFNKAILGLSGGIDSAVTLVLSARALGPENIRAILLPSQFSSDHSVKDAEETKKFKEFVENLKPEDFTKYYKKD